MPMDTSRRIKPQHNFTSFLAISQTLSMVVAMPVNIKEGQVNMSGSCCTRLLRRMGDWKTWANFPEFSSKAKRRRFSFFFSVGGLKDMAMLSTEVFAVYQYCVSCNQVKGQRYSTTKLVKVPMRQAVVRSSNKSELISLNGLWLI